MLLGGAAGAVLYLAVELKVYRDIAAGFDLSTIGQMESASLIYDRENALMGKIFIQNRIPVPYTELPEKLVQAVIAEEDNRFYSHKGVDYIGIVRAAIANYRAGRVTQGASTVTQQLARNSFNLKERSMKRKVIEMFLAERIEQELTKDKIMELYLNRVYFGSGFYGAEAAARGYFGISAKQMDAGQCAMLAGILKSPNGLSPWRDRDGAKSARDFVLDRMREMNFLTRREYDDAVSAPLVVRKRSNSMRLSYALDYIRQQAIAALGFDQAMNAGFKIFTTIDSGMQRATEVALRRTLDKVEKTPGYSHPLFAHYDAGFQELEKKTTPGLPVQNAPVPNYLQGAAIAYENRTGGILTMVGGRDFLHSEYNRATQAQRPSGTAFTPFVYAAAYTEGMYPGEIVQDAAMDNRYVMVGGETGILGEWGVEVEQNDYEGPIPAREALSRGKNAATVRVGMTTGLDKVKTMAGRAGIRSPIRDFANAYLGSSEASLDELTLAYTVFPNGGWRPKASYIIQRIEDNEGRVVYEAPQERADVLPAGAAYQVHLSLLDALRGGPSSAAYSSMDLGNFPAAGKPGTAYNFTDTYFFGYTSNVTCGVWVGFDKPTKIFRGAFGKDLALPIWVDAMNASVKEFPPQEFTRPVTLKEIQVSRQTGLPANSALSRNAAKAMGITEDPSRNVTELATDEQIAAMQHRAAGALDKDYDQQEWPKAASALDLALVPPIAVQAAPLLGFADPYNSIRPTAVQFDKENIPVARALPADGSEPPPIDAPVAPVAIPEPVDREVRRAEPVRPMDSPGDLPAIAVEAPQPIKF